MPNRKPRTPSYCRQKRSGRPDLVYVKMSGKRIYLGDYGSDESREAYRRTIARWLANEKAAPQAMADELTVIEVIARYWRHCLAYYVGPDGKPTGSETRIKGAMRALKETFGHTVAAAFGPLDLQAMQKVWIAADCSRVNINKRTSEVKKLFKWAASQELLPAAVYHALQTVEGLRYGRWSVRESQPRQPVPQADVDAVLPELSRQVAATKLSVHS